jgi:hypothetical protein
VSGPERSEKAEARRPRRGRPPLPAGEAKVKRYPLTIRSTKAMKEELSRAAKASGRSLAEDMEDRLARSLWEDRDKGPVERRLEILMRQVADLVRLNWNAGVGAVDTPQPSVLTEHHGDRQAASKTIARGRFADFGKPGQPGRLLPVEVFLRQDDDTVVLVWCHGEHILLETAVDIGTFQRVVADELASRGRSQKAEPPSIEPKRGPRRRRA